MNAGKYDVVRRILDEMQPSEVILDSSAFILEQAPTERSRSLRTQIYDGLRISLDEMQVFGGVSIRKICNFIGWIVSGNTRSTT